MVKMNVFDGMRDGRSEDSLESSSFIRLHFFNREVSPYLLIECQATIYRSSTGSNHIIRDVFMQGVL